MPKTKQPELDTPGGRLQWARGRHYRSARAAAEVLLLAESTVRAHEAAGLAKSHSRNYGEDEAKRYGRAYGVSWEWLIWNKGAPTKGVSGPPSEIEVPTGRPADTISAVVRLPSGLRRYFTAESELSIAPEEPVERLIGRECVIRQPGGQLIVRTIRKGSKPGLYTLESPGHEPLKDQHIERAAPVTNRATQ